MDPNPTGAGKGFTWGNGGRSSVDMRTWACPKNKASETRGYRLKQRAKEGRVLRCGNWYNDPDHIRLAKTYNALPFCRISKLGFRLKQPTRENRVLCGGSHALSPRLLRSGNRLNFPPSSRVNNLGFRLVQR